MTPTILELFLHLVTSQQFCHQFTLSASDGIHHFLVKELSGGERERRTRALISIEDEATVIYVPLVSFSFSFLFVCLFLLRVIHLQPQ